MSRCTRATLFFVLFAAAAAAEEFPLTLDDITVRDPFIHADEAARTYYLYAQTGNRKGNSDDGVEAYRSKDLVHWSEPKLVFKRSDDFWGGKEIWAPEMHKLGEKYYLFVSFNGREGGRGTQILRAGSPDGPFTFFSESANTPRRQRSLDGTPFVDHEGRNWMTYCHEWVQIGDGAMLAVPMSDDWSRRTGKPIHLFHASDAPWARPLGAKEGKYVTDGCFLYRTTDGRLLMLWSSFTGEQGRTYAVGIVHSESGTIQGPWKHEAKPIFAGNGGHPMLFRTFYGQLTLALHQPNGGAPARARLFAVEEVDGTLRITPWKPK
jgi:beta-xylosidase